LNSPPAASEKPDLRRQGTSRRWYYHGWNTPLSWKLILRITPRLPRFVLAPLHHITSLVFFICMPRERAAARRNLRRVTGKTGLANLRLAYRLFWNFSRFLVAYTEIKDLDLDQFRDRLIGVDEVEEGLRRILGEGRGIIIVTMHLGHWDLGLKHLAAFLRPVHVVIRNEDPEEITRYADEARRFPDLRVHQTGGDPLLAVDLMLALKRGEMVAIQVDRPVGRILSTLLFGAWTPLPTGPVQLAMATGAPLVPAFVLFDRGRRYRPLLLPPLRLDRPRPGEEERALREGMLRMAGMMESVASRYPDQWFNFYDVWPEPDAPASGVNEKGRA
jgi:KDO2-lipid IV(A) lauroyltransferase